MTRASFDALFTRLSASSTTLSERELLEHSHWSLGEDARLREDLRFRETPWGRWMLAADFVANDAVYRWLHAERRGSVKLDAALARAGAVFGRRCVFCPGDPRLVLRSDEIRLAASELTREPVVEPEVGDLEKYITHLPVHSLKAAAASEAAGEWGKRAQHEVIETLGWVRVTVPGRHLDDRMFVAAIEGHSMDDGKSGLVDGGYAVFELWPPGPCDNLKVLVRGTFSDPETGSYAVKKYVVDGGAPDGSHAKVALVSLNPDRERYPDLDLGPAQKGDLAVVAKVLHALSADDYERRPKPRRVVGRRDLDGEEQVARLGRRLASFFDAATPELAEDGTPPPTRTGWKSALVCLDVASGGLHLEVGPLAGLPGFVKKLRVSGVEWDAVVLAANAKVRSTRLPVRPGTGPWAWAAVGYEDEQDLGLECLALAAVERSAPAVFHVDADGVGQRLMGTTLSLGHEYRLLLPPNVGEAHGTPLDGGWRIWPIDLAKPLSPTTRSALSALGLEVGELCPRIEWALSPAAAWGTNARGESYPVFEAGSELFVSVGGSALEDGDTLVLFLCGPSSTARLPLKASGLVSLGTPTVGPWLCALVDARVSAPIATLVFEVARHAIPHIHPESTAAAPNRLSSLEATAPPGWPVTLRWRVLASMEDSIGTLHGNDDRTVPVEEIAALIEARVARTRIADLVVDFGELGRHAIPHDGRPSLDQVRERLTSLWQQRAALVTSHCGAWLALMNVWFEPITALLGYGIEALESPADNGAAHDLAAWRLTVDERLVGSIVRSTSRVLVLTTDIDAVLRDHRQWIDGVCSLAKVRDAIVTDGMRWTTHRKGSQQLKQQVWNLEHAIGLGSIDDMLGDLAEGL